MNKAMRYMMLCALAAMVPAANAQFYRMKALKGASVTIGGFGQFSQPIPDSSNTTGGSAAFPGGPGSLTETTSNQQQYTTLSAGVVGSLDFHPVSWAGVEVNYAYTHYSERYTFNASSATATQAVSVDTGMHEATGAYVFHPKHIPFQPFLNVGGGAIYFSPYFASAAQWRGTGLLETGFDIPTHNPHLAFRVEGRGLFYRAPNFNTPTLSSRSWRATAEPAVSAVYRF